MKFGVFNDVKWPIYLCLEDVFGGYCVELLKSEDAVVLMEKQNKSVLVLSYVFF